MEKMTSRVTRAHLTHPVLVAMTTTIGHHGTGIVAGIGTGTVTGTETEIATDVTALSLRLTLPMKWSTVLAFAIWTACVGCHLVTETHTLTHLDFHHLCPLGTHTCILGTMTSFLQDRLDPLHLCMTEWVHLLVSPLPLDPPCPGILCLTDHPMPVL